MESNRRWITLDWIKLGAALVLLYLVLFFVFQPLSQRKSQRAALPPYPVAPFPWQLDESQNRLLDTSGNALYSLSTDRTRWIAILPPEFSGKLPADAQLWQNINGDWVILGEQGKRFAVLSAEKQQWTLDLALTQPLPTEPPTATASPAPSATSTWTVQPSATQVASATSPATQTAQPTATSLPSTTPTSIPSATPTTAASAAAQTKPDSSGAFSASYGCPIGLSSQLAVGDIAKAKTNLYLRRDPAIGDNVISYHVVGTLLKVLDGPQCVPYGNGYYLWWQVESPYGSVGWSAENALYSGEYLMVPAY